MRFAHAQDAHCDLRCAICVVRFALCDLRVRFAICVRFVCDLRVRFAHAQDAHCDLRVRFAHAQIAHLNTRRTYCDLRIFGSKQWPLISYRLTKILCRVNMIKKDMPLQEVKKKLSNFLYFNLGVDIRERFVPYAAGLRRLGGPNTGSSIILRRQNKSSLLLESNHWRSLIAITGKKS